MRGEKFEQAKRALRFCLEGLGERGRFNVVQFATGVNPFRTGLAGLAGLAELAAAAKGLKEMKGRSVLPGLSAATVKHVGAKTFYLRGGAWVDSAYREGMKTMNLLPFSDAYFEVLKRVPELAKYLAISKNLVVVHGSACYRISE